MRVLVTGVKGQLGHDVMDELAAKGIEALAWMWRKWISQTQMPARE